MKYTGIGISTGQRLFYFPIQDAKPSDKYIFKGADGLEPTGMTNFLSRPRYGKGQYLGREPLPRQVTLKVNINPDYTAGESVQQLREDLYSLMNPMFTYGDKVNFVLMDGSTYLTKNWAVVKSVEPSLFSRDPYIQIVLEFLDPYFTGYEPIIVPGGSEPGETLSTTTLAFNNKGSAQVGFGFQIKITANIPSWGMFGPDLKPYMVITYPFLANDLLSVSTIPGSRSVVLTRNGVNTSIIHAFYAGLVRSDWIMLGRGPNAFAITRPNFEWVLCAYVPEYLGV